MLCRYLRTLRLTTSGMVSCQNSPASSILQNFLFCRLASCSTRDIVKNSSAHSKRSAHTDASTRADRTVDVHEMDRFRRLVAEWWKPGGSFSALRSMNRLRVPAIRDRLLLGEKPVSTSRPLRGFQLLDVGCGGGILSEPLARLGASVTGIDPLEENIEAARIHAQQDPQLNDNIRYLQTTAEEHSIEESNYDMVIASEVVEHVDHLELFIESCCKLIKPNGHLFISTINRTVASTLLAKYTAEYILQIVPKDTHDPSKFVKPSELTESMRRNNMVEIEFSGSAYNPLFNTWCQTRSLAMNYFCFACRPR